MRRVVSVTALTTRRYALVQTVYVFNAASAKMTEDANVAYNGAGRAGSHYLKKEKCNVHSNANAKTIRSLHTLIHTALLKIFILWMRFSTRHLYLLVLCK